MSTNTSMKTVAETLQDLRVLFGRYEVEEWEPIRNEENFSYAVRYRTGGPWVMISSHIQPTRAKNLRQCYQVIQYLFLWASRGVGGVSQGVTFIGSSLVKVGPEVIDESLEEAYATLGVDSTAGLQEIGALYRTKMRFNHPDGINDPEEKRQREERCKRLNEAWGLVEKARESK
mgnify:CR=1 FL=1